ncbi:MAG: CapA family protein, partial [Bacteroidales bacterium]|nr:CapA family protein [Bacteroidales bacterium]
LANDYNEIYNDFINVFRENDLNVSDLECPLTLSENARPKIGPHQKARPECVRALKYAGINVVAMANNHIMDYDLPGALDTLEICRRNNIDTVGMGRNEEEAAKPFSTIIREKRIALLNFADNEFLSSTDNTLVCSGLNPVQLYYSIKDARASHDYVIAIIHAGNEFYELPSPRTKKLYRFIIDLGADAVISHHTHAFSGFEVYKTKPIFYGLGNFIYDFPGKRNEAWNFGYAVRLFLSEIVSFEIIPLQQGNERPGVFHLEDKEMVLFHERINSLNETIGDDIRLELEFRKYCKSVYPMYDSYIEPGFGRYVSFLRRRGFFPRLLTIRKRLLLLNIIRCESHSDVLTRMLAGWK